MAFFNARDEQTRKVFFDELLDCIEEVGISRSFSLFFDLEYCCLFFFVGVSMKIDQKAILIIMDAELQAARVSVAVVISKMATKIASVFANLASCF